MAVTPLLSLEDHFLSSACRNDIPMAKALHLDSLPQPIFQDLVDLGSKRIETMEKGGVQVQVVSHVPVALDYRPCRDTNDQLANAVKQSGGRLRGFATLPMADPTRIAAELERCVVELGFVGALIPNHVNGVYYDGSDYLPMWEAAERLNVPIYLHPSPPSTETVPSFAGAYPESVAGAISRDAWDWHANCGMHFVRLYASGLFDQCPNLKIVLGHLGEMVPFMLNRIEKKLTHTQISTKTSLAQIWARNIWVTTSGMFDIECLKLVLSNTSIDRIMFSVDFPFESTVGSAAYMERVSRLLAEEDVKKIAYKNAEKLLNIRMGS